jgi:uncharacterized coiled-coil protein SlyX
LIHFYKSFRFIKVISAITANFSVMKLWALHLSCLMVVIPGTLGIGQNAKQDKKIAELEKKIAEQDENMAEMARNVKLIQSVVAANHPGSKALLEGTLSTTPTTPQDNLLLMTGGYNGNSRLSSTETYPSTSACSPPSLPLARAGHTTFVTAEPTSLVATCGGVTGETASCATCGGGGGRTASCLVLDPINQRWDESRMGSLTMERVYGAAATLDNIGVFIVGGQLSNSARTSEFLAAGTMQWQEGPALPVDMYRGCAGTDCAGTGCAVPVTPTSFLSIHLIEYEGTYIREFDAAIAGPTSSEGWREAGRWPLLKTSRNGQPGCAKIGQKVIIAGGFNGVSLTSTEVLDLVNRRITSGGEMATPRCFFNIATIIIRGEEKMFALAGRDRSPYYYDSSTIRLNTVEEWVEESSTWKAADNLVEKRNSFGIVSAPRHLVC